MAFNRKLKPKIVEEKEDLNSLEDGIREVVVEHRSGFNTIEVLFLVLIAIVFGAVIGYGLSLFRQEYQENKESSSLQELVTVYHNILDDYYKKIDETALADAAIDGMLSSLDDPYSTYLEGENAEAFHETVDGSYVGIGVTVARSSDGSFLVVGVVEDSPADKAKIQVGDLLIKVSGKSLDELNLDDVMDLMNGQKNKKVKLTLKREDKTYTKSLEPSTIAFKSVDSKVYALNNGNAGYISISSFSANTYSQFKEELLSLEERNINSLVIDVRSNPGGHLSQTKEILELFMKKGSVLYQVQVKNKVTKIKDETKNHRNYPVVILTNSSSASAAEILASSFRDSYSDTVIIGDSTYGKGTIQTAYNLSNGTSIKYTTEKWLTPNGQWIDGNGITPDIVVQLTEDYLSNPVDSNDLQLQRALDFLETKRNTSEN